MQQQIENAYKERSCAYVPCSLEDQNGFLVRDLDDGHILLIGGVLQIKSKELVFFVRFLIEVAQDVKTMRENLASVGVDDVEDLAARCLHREMLKNWSQNWSHGGREMRRKKRAPRYCSRE